MPSSVTCGSKPIGARTMWLQFSNFLIEYHIFYYKLFFYWKFKYWWQLKKKMKECFNIDRRNYFFNILGKLHVSIIVTCISAIMAWNISWVWRNPPNWRVNQIMILLLIGVCLNIFIFISAQHLQSWTTIVVRCHSGVVSRCTHFISNCAFNR